MSMSVDTRQIELAVQFASLLELLMDPKKLRGTIEEIKVVLADYKDKLGLIATKQEADSYLEKARVTLEEANAYLAKEKKEQDHQANQLLSDLKIKKEEVQRTLDVLSKRQATADLNFKESERMKQESERILLETEAKEKALSLKILELKALEAKLNEKQAKLNQILG